MKTYSLVLVLIVVLINTLPNRKFKHAFPELRKLEEVGQTDFIPTLHHSFDSTKNSIYAATKSLVWDELKSLYADSIVVSPKHKDLTILNGSTLHRNGIAKDDYESKITLLEDGVVSIETKMEVEFEYVIPFEKFNDRLEFDGKIVQSFGYLNNKREASQNLQVSRVIYFDDDNFLIQLATEGNDQITLLKTENKYSKPTELINDLTRFEKQHDLFQEHYATFWRTEFLDKDIVLIPMISFNLQKKYRCFEGNTFHIGSKEMTIGKSIQSIAFVMNEKGVRFKSIALDEIFSSSENNDESKPKELIFDKPFYILLTKRNKNIPYFIAAIRNSELMILGD